MSGRKNVTEPTLLGDANTSLAASVEFPAQNIKYLDNVGLVMVITGTPTGSFLVEFRIGDKGTWTDSGLVIPASGAPTVHNVNLNQVPFEQYRVRYARTSGDGTVTIVGMTKMV